MFEIFSQIFFSFLAYLFSKIQKENNQQDYEEVQDDDEEQGNDQLNKGEEQGNDQLNKGEEQGNYQLNKGEVEGNNNINSVQNQVKKNLLIENQFQLKIQCSISSQQQNNQNQQDFQILHINQPYYYSEDLNYQTQNLLQFSENSSQQHQQNKDHVSLELNLLEIQQETQGCRFIESPQNFNQENIQNDSGEQNTNNIQNTTENLSNSFDSLDQAKSQIIVQKCYRCQTQIKKQYFQTSCLHNYDYECLEEMISNQLMQDSKTQISCLCNKKLNQKVLLQFEQNKSIQLKETLYSNQLNNLKSRLFEEQKIQVCDNQECKYFWISQSRDGVCQYCQN